MNKRTKRTAALDGRVLSFRMLMQEGRTLGSDAMIVLQDLGVDLWLNETEEMKAAGVAWLGWCQSQSTADEILTFSLGTTPQLTACGVQAMIVQRVHPRDLVGVDIPGEDTVARRLLLHADGPLWEVAVCVATVMLVAFIGGWKLGSGYCYNWF